MTLPKKIRYSFKCSQCGWFAKQLYGVSVEYEDKKAQILVCRRCLKKMGLLKGGEEVKGEDLQNMWKEGS